MKTTTKREEIRAKLNLLRSPKLPKPIHNQERIPNLAGLNAKYVKKYKHFVTGSLRQENGNTKLRAQILCCVRGCKTKREVYTSDIFQVKYCFDHKINHGKV